MNNITYLICLVFLCYFCIYFAIDEYDKSQISEPVIEMSQGKELRSDFLIDIKENFSEILTEKFVYELGMHISRYNKSIPINDVLSEIPEELKASFVRGYNETAENKQKVKK